jgi:hypothetical protein
MTDKKGIVVDIDANIEDVDCPRDGREERVHRESEISPRIRDFHSAHNPMYSSLRRKGRNTSGSAVNLATESDQGRGSPYGGPVHGAR